MAGHYSLKETDEPKLFYLVNYVKKSLIDNSKDLKDFSRFGVMFKSNVLTAMKLSKDYANSPDEVAFTLGKVNLKSLSDQHRSLTHQISVEVHLSLKDDKIEISNIYWVA